MRILKKPPTQLGQRRQLDNQIMQAKPELNVHSHFLIVQYVMNQQNRIKPCYFYKFFVGRAMHALMVDPCLDTQRALLWTVS